MKKLLIATTNPGKVREYKGIFKKLKLPISLISLKDLGIIKKVKENGKTFRENAIKKAKFYQKIAKIPVLSDDAGLEINYLNGEPGVKSRRWPGYEASDEELINLTLKKLNGVPDNKRGAQLKSVIGLSLPGVAKVYTFEGKLKGFIGNIPIKKRIAGYPFRSLFKLSKKGKYLGEMNITEAHRKEAVKKALPIIKKYLC
ncbi:non-canonical purine NTP pyrophosphatase [Patescibacteria group bacterium]